jgi:hypothetical protein
MRYEVTADRRVPVTRCVGSIPSIRTFDTLPRVGEFQLNRSDPTDMLETQGSAGPIRKSRLWATPGAMGGELPRRPPGSQLPYPARLLSAEPC